jgi:vancomycin resistance protein YoaR
LKFGASRKAGVIALIIAVPIIAAIVITLSFSAGDRVCKGVAVSGISLGGLTREQANQKLRSLAEKRSGRRITLTALDTRWSGKFADFGAQVKWKDSADRAFAVGRKGNIFNRVICVLTSKGSGKRFKAEIAVNDARIEKTITKIARAVNRPHADAKIKVIDGRLDVKQDSMGIKIDEQSAKRTIANALHAGKMVVALPIVADKPDITADDARKINTLLARFTTPFNPGKRDRSHNLLLAANSIDGIIIKPGEEFSYNKVVGPRDLDRGFKNAPIFVKGKLEPGVGGGICQVSTTLYNAVLLAGMHIVERHPHSRTVPYVRPGRDATVAYGLRDFKFTNSNKSPICLLSDIRRGNLTVDIYGSADDKKTIKIFTGAVTYSPPKPDKSVIDPTVAPGTVIDKGSRGVSVTVYRKVLQPDGTAVTDIVSKDRYPAQPKLIAMGRVVAETKPAEASDVALQPTGQ